jgi:hypothetical protein
MTNDFRDKVLSTSNYNLEVRIYSLSDLLHKQVLASISSFLILLFASLSFNIHDLLEQYQFCF